MTDQPFIPPDQVDPDWIATHVAYASHPHIAAMIEYKSDLLKAHTMMHLLSSDPESMPAHQECLDKLEAIQPDLDRAWSGLWN